MSADLYYPGATYRGPTANHGGEDTESRGLVVHIAEGTYEGTIAWQRNDTSDVSSEFVIARTGAVAQMMPANEVAWTQRVGNGHWDAVEMEGYSTAALTAAQIEACARLFVWGHQVRGWPLQLATSPSGRGLGHHSMGAENGVDWGHSECPGPLIKNQKPAILARAIQIVNGGDDMAFTDAQEQQILQAAGFAEAQAWRVEAIFNNRPAVIGGPHVGKPEGVNKLYVALAAQQGALTAADVQAVQGAAQTGARAALNGATATIRPAS